MSTLGPTKNRVQLVSSLKLVAPRCNEVRSARQFVTPRRGNDELDAVADAVSSLILDRPYRRPVLVPGGGPRDGPDLDARPADPAPDADPEFPHPSSAQKPDQKGGEKGMMHNDRHAGATSIGERRSKK